MTALKALLYVLIAVAGSSAALFTADGWDGPGALNVAVVAVGALGVWLKTNTPTQPWAKALVALFTAGAAVLVSAWTDRRIDPVEWQQIVLAVLGAAAVAAAANNSVAPADGRHELGRSDVGGAAVRAVLIAGALLGLVLVAVPASAAARPPRPVMPVVSQAWDCEGVLVVAYQRYRLDGRMMSAVMDDGRARVEVRDVSGRSQPDGTWLRLASVSGGEGWLRAPAWRSQRGMHGAHPDLVRVVRTDRDRVVSYGAYIMPGCPA